MNSIASSTRIPNFQRPVHCLLGLPFDAINLSQAGQHLRDAAASGAPCFFSTPNLNFLIAAQADVAFRNSVIHSDLSVADGMPIVWLAKLLNIPIAERVAGSDLFEYLRKNPVGKKITVYFFGGPPGVAKTAAEKLNADVNGGLHCVGFESPGFGSIEAMSSVETRNNINQSKADFVLVALGAKKGQAWIVHNQQKLNSPIISHLGAVVNFVAGTVSRAPGWMQKTGLEWFWRIRQEPDLWRRYANDALDLLKMLATRVLPLMVCQRLQAEPNLALASTAFEATPASDTTTIRLTGVWTEKTLLPLRSEFARAAHAGQRVHLDLSATTHVDSAFLGLLLLLYGHQTAIGQPLLITGATPAVKRVFRYSGVAYLLSAATR